MLTQSLYPAIYRSNKRATVRWRAWIGISLCVFFVSMGGPFCQGTEGGEKPDHLGAIAGTKKAEKVEKKKQKDILVEVGDKVRVTIYPADQYIKGVEMQVSSEGAITLPMIGKVGVQGKKVAQIEKEISELLKDYLVSPIVVVEVTRSEEVEEAEKETVSILGQVKKPGTYDLPEGEKFTLLKLISESGGFTDVANVRKIKVIRKNGEKSRVLHANAEAIISGKQPDIELEPEDVVHVGESFF